MPTKNKPTVPTPTASAPTSTLLSCGTYKIVPKPSPVAGNFVYDILRGEQYVGTYPDIYQALDCFIDDLKNSQRVLLDRLKNPAININFSVR